MEFSEKQLEKASKAKSAEELISFAKEEGITLTNDDAEKYFKMLNTKEGELADEELDNVAGGTCYSKGVHGPNGFKRYAIVTVANSCRLFDVEGGGKSGQLQLEACARCRYSFTAGTSLYCSIRTIDNDPV